jgi:Transposase, Mutator family
MLVEALETEVAAYLETHRDERDGEGRALVVRNGKGRTRKVTVGAGTIPVSAFRVNDRRTDQDGERHRFTSRILPPYMRRSPKVAEVLPVLYLRGLSTSRRSARQRSASVCVTPTNGGAQPTAMRRARATSTQTSLLATQTPDFDTTARRWKHVPSSLDQRKTRRAFTLRIRKSSAPTLANDAAEPLGGPLSGCRSHPHRLASQPTIQAINVAPKGTPITGPIAVSSPSSSFSGGHGSQRFA